MRRYNQLPPLGIQCKNSVASGLAGPNSLVADSTSVYWVNLGTSTDLGSVMKVDRSGGTPTTIASGYTFPRSITADTTHIYWTVSGKGMGDGMIVKLKK